LPNGGIYNSINLHTYHYTNNNPINYVDPDGRFPNGHSSYPHGSGQKMNFFQYSKISQTPKPKTPSPVVSLGDRVTYTAMGLDAIGPCYERALIGVAETFAGRNLTINELNQLHTTLTSGEQPLVKGSNFLVQDSQGVISAALAVLEPGKNFSVNIAGPNDSNYEDVKKNAVGSLLRVPGPHWQEGDKTGSFRWDGYSGLNNEHKDAIITEKRYVSIE